MQYGKLLILNRCIACMSQEDQADLEYWEKRLKAAEPDILPENYLALRKHMKDIKEKKPRTKINHLMVLMRFTKKITKPFLDLQEFDLEDYFDSLKLSKSTIRLHMATVKVFLKNVNPVASATIKPPRIKNTLKPADLLTFEEIEKLIEAAGNKRDKALIACYYDSGARKDEILSTTIEGAKFDNNGCRLWLNESKTDPRPARLTYASSYLKDWLDEHPRKHDPKAPIFCSNRKPHNLISRGGFYHRIDDIHIRSGVTKRSTPHQLRHMRATDLAKKVNGSEQKLKAILGWSPNSQMASTYIHLSGDDIDEMMLEAVGIKKEEEEAEKPKTYRCPRCKEMNAVTQERCWKCGYSEKDPVIDEDALVQKIKGTLKEELNAVSMHNYKELKKQMQEMEAKMREFYTVPFEKNIELSEQERTELEANMASLKRKSK